MGPKIPIQTSIPRKLRSVNGDVEDADVVIVYGNVNGSIKKCKTVVVINGNVNGDVKNNETVAGYLARGDA